MDVSPYTAVSGMRATPVRYDVAISKNTKNTDTTASSDADSVEFSDTDKVKEALNSIKDGQYFSANSNFLRAHDQLLGTLESVMNLAPVQ